MLQYTIYDLDGEWRRFGRVEGLGGSGCSPGTADTLPDGIWFGRVTEWGSSWVDFDLACYWHWGTEQYDQICGDGDSCQAISNDSAAIRRLVLNADSVAWVDLGWGDSGPLRYSAPYGLLDLSQLNEVTTTGGYCSAHPEGSDDAAFVASMLCGGWVWLYINDGVVTELLDRYES